MTSSGSASRITASPTPKEWFERGFLAAYAEATVQNDCTPPFELTDAVIEKAWDCRDAASDTGAAS